MAMAVTTVRGENKMRTGNKPPPALELSDEIRLGLRLLAKLARIAEQACQSTGISLPQYRLLSEIATSPSRASHLATRPGVTRPTLTSLVNGLEHAGLMVRVPVLTDRRGIQLRATNEGLAAVSRAETALAERMRGLASPAHLTDVTSLARHMSNTLAQQAASSKKTSGRPRHSKDRKFKLRFPTVG